MMERQLSLFCAALALISPQSVESTLLKVISVVENDVVFSAPCKWNRELKSADGLEGLLIAASPPDACSPVTPPPNANDSYLLDPNYFLIASSAADCSVYTKIGFAERAGYAAIVIQLPPQVGVEKEPFSSYSGPYSSLDHESDDWGDGLSVYPCLVSFGDGKKLRNNYTGDDFIMHFEDDGIDTWTKFFITSFLALIAILLAIALSYCVVQMFILLVIWIRDSIVNYLNQRRINRRRRLPARQLKKIPVQAWSSDIPQDMCTICLENYEENDKVRILPCSHVFHMNCVDRWLLYQRRKCPNCKRKLVFPDEPYDSDSSTEDERTPLIRREGHGHGQGSGSLDHSAGGLTFTFNESDFASHQQPIYRAIHRMMLEANARRLAAAQSQSQSQSQSQPQPGTSASNNSVDLCNASISSTDRAQATIIRNARLSRFCPRNRLPQYLFRSRTPTVSVIDDGHGHGHDHASDYVEDTVDVAAADIPEGPSSRSFSGQGLEDEDQDQITHIQFLEEANRAYEASLQQLNGQCSSTSSSGHPNNNDSV